MPSGYTAEIGTRDDLTFREFALGCARAMGACIMQRDDPGDAPIDLEEKPSECHAQSLEACRNNLARLRAMTPDDAARALREDADRCLRLAAESREDTERLRKRYERMLAAVQQWVPPTPDHAGLKQFMVEQITESIKFDCHDSDFWQEEADKTIALTPDEWLAKKIDAAAGRIYYHETEQAQEVARVNARNAWKRALVSSL